MLLSSAVLYDTIIILKTASIVEIIVWPIAIIICLIFEIFFAGATSGEQCSKNAKDEQRNKLKSIEEAIPLAWLSENSDDDKKLNFCLNLNYS